MSGIPKEIGGLAKYKLISAASTNATSITSSQTRVYTVYAHNVNAAVRYLKVYDKSTAPTVGTDVPILTLPIPGNTAGAGFVMDSEGFQVSNGLAVALTTGIADSDTGAVGGNETVVNFLYKA
jgi:hypothetical protein